MIGVVHEHPRIGSDGESEEGSGTSEDPNVSPTSDEIAINNGKQVTIHHLCKSGAGFNLQHLRLGQLRSPMWSSVKSPLAFGSCQTRYNIFISVSTLFIISSANFTTIYNLVEPGGDQQETLPTCRPQVTRQLHHQTGCQPHPGGSYNKVCSNLGTDHVICEQSCCFLYDPTLYLTNWSQSKPDLAHTCHPDLPRFLPVLLVYAQCADCTLVIFILELASQREVYMKC